MFFFCWADQYVQRLSWLSSLYLTLMFRSQNLLVLLTMNITVPKDKHKLRFTLTCNVKVFSSNRLSLYAKNAFSVGFYFLLIHETIKKIKKNLQNLKQKRFTHNLDESLLFEQCYIFTSAVSFFLF